MTEDCIHRPAVVCCISAGGQAGLPMRNGNFSTFVSLKSWKRLEVNSKHPFSMS